MDEALRLSLRHLFDSTYVYMKSLAIFHLFFALLFVGCSDGGTGGKRERQSSVPRFEKQASKDARKITFDELECIHPLDYRMTIKEITSLLPIKIVAANGNRVSLRGYMGATFEDRDITEFLLLKNSDAYGYQDRNADEIVVIKLAEDISTHRLPPLKTIKVVGRFKINITIEDSCISALYEINNATIVSTPD